jgi:hypothetical protein
MAGVGCGEVVTSNDKPVESMLRIAVTSSAACRRACTTSKQGAARNDCIDIAAAS